MGFWVLLWVEVAAYLSQLLCSQLHTSAAYCALGSVSSGVNTRGIRHGDSLCTLPICCVEARLMRQT